MAVQLYRTDFERLTAEDLARWSDIPPAIASDCMNRSNVMSGRISPLAPGMKLCGQARTVICMVGDNGAAHVAIGLAEPDDILVIDARGHIETAVWGGIMTRAAMQRDIGGAVIDGAVRDAAEIRVAWLPDLLRRYLPGRPVEGVWRHH